jgi:hypothetical protein
MTRLPPRVRKLCCWLLQNAPAPTSGRRELSTTQTSILCHPLHLSVPNTPTKSLEVSSQLEAWSHCQIDVIVVWYLRIWPYKLRAGVQITRSPRRGSNADIATTHHVNNMVVVDPVVSALSGAPPPAQPLYWHSFSALQRRFFFLRGFTLWFRRFHFRA